MSKYDELKRLAEAATKGDWSVDRLAVTADTRSLVCCGQAYLECCGNPDVDGDEYDPICSATSESEAAYIAAANPAVIIELIAENERLREQCELNDLVHGTKGRERVAALLAQSEELRKDAAAGAVVWKFIDRMGDPAECDPAEDILAEFVAAFDAAMQEASK